MSLLPEISYSVLNFKCGENTFKNWIRYQFKYTQSIKMQQLTAEPAAFLLSRKQSHAPVQPPPRPHIPRSSNSPSFYSFNLRNTFAIIIIPLGALLCTPWVPLKNKTLLFGVFYAYLRSFAIVTGTFLL